jgi:ketosteroid isomerase-like protein
MEFDEALRRHLGTVQKRDLTGLVATLHPEVAVLLSNGTLVEGRDKVVELHREWFADPDWSIEFRTMRQTVLPDFASVVLAVAYRDVDPDGKPIAQEYFLGLCFARTGDGWLLVHDQNSVVR